MWNGAKRRLASLHSAFRIQHSTLFLNFNVEHRRIVFLIERYSQNGQPIPFKKVTLLLFQDDGKPGQYYTDESFEEDDDPTVFYVEIKE